MRMRNKKNLIPRMERCAAVQDRVNAAIDALIRVGVFRGVKGMLNLLGLDCGDCRKPFAPLEKEEYAQLEAALRALEG